MKLKFLEKQFWVLALVKRIIADLVQKWGDNNTHFLLSAQNGLIQSFDRSVDQIIFTSIQRQTGSGSVAHIGHRRWLIRGLLIRGDHINKTLLIT